MSSTPFEIRRDLVRLATDIVMQNSNNKISMQTQLLDALREELEGDHVTYRCMVEKMKVDEITADQIIKEAQKLNDFVSASK